MHCDSGGRRHLPKKLIDNNCSFFVPFSSIKNITAVQRRFRTTSKYFEHFTLPASDKCVFFPFSDDNTEVETYPQASTLSFDENRSLNDDTFTSKEYSFSK